MNISLLILTSVSVSIDCFLFGLTLSLQKRKVLTVAVVTLTVFLMCLFANYFPFLLPVNITAVAPLVGGIILISVGVYNILSKESDGNLPFLSGIAVGSDGAIANLSLSIMGINGIIVPVTIAFFHFIAITTGILLSKTLIGDKVKLLKIISPVILILLGGYKVITFFI